ncbi:hypothetical protein ACM66B_000651 [Microbotryomycetes sp. NB124-2]
MSLTDEQKRERLSKAMGAAFLSHKVAELEKSVDSLAFSRDQRLYGNSGGQGRHVRTDGPGSAATRAGLGQRHKHGRGGGHRDDLNAVRPAGARERRVVDASALVFALPVLKRWVRQDTYQLIVPLSALSTLDILKKAPNPIHDLARDATKFLESQFDIAKQIEATLGPVEANARVRLRAQSANEELSWTQVENLFRIPPDFVVTGLEQSRHGAAEPAADEEVQARVPIAADIPRSLRSTLQCALYFNHGQLSSPVVLYKSGAFTNPYANPDTTSTLSNTPATLTKPDQRQSQSSTTIDFDAIASGDALSFWISTFFCDPLASRERNEDDNEDEHQQFSGVSIDVVSKGEVQAARAWFKEMASAMVAQNDGGGKQRGGEAGSSRGTRGGTRGQSGRGKIKIRGRGGFRTNTDGGAT